MKVTRLEEINHSLSIFCCRNNIPVSKDKVVGNHHLKKKV